MSRVQKLAAQILQDRERLASRGRERRERAPGSEFDPFNFESQRIIAGGDPGFLPRAMRKGPEGFYIDCRACGAEFDSKGWAFCPTCLELPAEERQAMRPTMQGRICQAPGCENFIDRKSRAGTRFCSQACRQRAGRVATAAERHG